MKKNIITVSREFGSGGRTIGKTVAQRLGIPYYDKELVKQVALESGFDPKYIEEHGEFAPGKTHFAFSFLGRGVPGVMGGMTAATFCGPSSTMSSGTWRRRPLCHCGPVRRLYPARPH